MKRNGLRFNHSRKGDMSINMIIGIVLGLIILAVAAYMIYDKSKQANAAGKCEAMGGICHVGKCPPSDRPDLSQNSITPCKIASEEGGKESYAGHCCYPE